MATESTPETAPEPVFVARVDGEQFVDALSRLADVVGELLVTVNTFELRLAALEAKGQRKGKGFNQL